jgi:SAM-dependent methyltransferase
MDQHHRASAEQIRALIEAGTHDPSLMRAVLLAVPPAARDAWVDLVLGLGEIPDDGPELPRGCVPYLPCPVDALLRLVDEAQVGPSDVFVDVGSGLGRAAALVHLLTGAAAIGLEIQTELAAGARRLAERLGTSRLSCVQGDAARLAGAMITGSVFFLYCPFGGERLAQVLADLESIARTRTIRVCCLDLRLPPRPWLALQPPRAEDLAVYRSLPRHRGDHAPGGSA